MQCTVVKVVAILFKALDASFAFHISHKKQPFKKLDHIRAVDISTFDYKSPNAEISV